MRVLEAMGQIVQLGGAAARAAHVAKLRSDFEERTGAFTPDDDWFEERSRAFWREAVTRMKFGREVEQELADEERECLGPLERAHRGLFHPALAAAAGQLFDARVAATDAGRGSLTGREEPPAILVALLPGAVFHPREATAPITSVLAAARARNLSTDDVLDALLRMERTLRSLSRVKAAYAYRADALSPRAVAVPARRGAGLPT